jgi:hypothetical protein
MGTGGIEKFGNSDGIPLLSPLKGFWRRRKARFSQWITIFTEKGGLGGNIHIFAEILGSS